MLLAVPALHAQTSASDIRAGRAALVAEEPAKARAQFTAALAQPDLSREDRYAASMGLGQATLWLGDYAAAGVSYRNALALALDPAAHRAASVGLAQALNAQDRPREALAQVAPFARGQLRPTVEVLRALQSLGWQTRSRPYLDAAPAAPAMGYLGTQYRLLQDDMEYAVAAKVEGDMDYSHDSEGLDTWHIRASYLAAPVVRGDNTFQGGAGADTTSVDDGTRHVRLNEASLAGQWQAGDMHRFDLALGVGHAGDWRYVQGNVRWSFLPNDGFALGAEAGRAPVLTATALTQHLIGDRYAIDASLRPSTRWYVVPGVYRQAFSDGNHRDGGSLRVLLIPYDVPNTTAALGAEFSTRLFHDNQPSRGIYFNPAQYHATQAGLIGIYSVSPRWKLRLNADAGRQWVNGAGAGIYTLDLSLEARLPGNGRLRVRVGRSSAASPSGGGAGYWNDSASVAVSYPL